MKKISAQKGIVHFPILLVILAVVGLAIWFFLNKGGLGSSGVKVQIPPSQLMPSVSAVEARTTICNLKKGGFFAQVCENKFAAVSKDNKDKTVELFTLLTKIQNDRTLSDYDRLLLAQVIFASLPTKDSSLNGSSLFLPLPLLPVAHAQEKAMNEEEFKKSMVEELKKTINNNLPEGDNVWVINLMVSRYSWLGNTRQPIYSEQYTASFDPNRGNPNVNAKDINYHIRSAVGQNSISNSSFSEMTAYSFSIMSWKSGEYAGETKPPEDNYLFTNKDFSELGYTDAPLLSGYLLDFAKFPSIEPKSDQNESKVDEQSDQTKGSKNVTCEEFKKIGEGNEDYKNLGWVHIEDWEGSGSHAYWFEKEGQLFDNSDYDHPKDVYKDRPPDYLISSSEWDKCNQGLQ